MSGGVCLASIREVIGGRPGRGGDGGLWRHRPGSGAGVRRQGRPGRTAGRGETGLDGAVKDIERAGGQALAIPTDVAEYGQVEAAAEQVTGTLGPIDIWVNVAFTSVFAPFTQIRPEEFKRVTEVSYLGYVYGTRAALDRMLARDQGTIVQVGSTLAYRGIPLQTAYCGAKHAIQGFTEALRCELLHQGSRVRITMVQLPAVNTPQFDWVLNRLPNHPRPVAPVYQPEVAAKAVVHAAGHPGRREYWVGGSTVGTLVANKLVPGLLDRYLARTGYEAQQTDQPVDPGRPVNLWEPVDGRGGRDFGGHGAFDDEAVNRSLQAWIGRHRGVAAAAGGLFASLLALKFLRR